MPSSRGPNRPPAGSGPGRNSPAGWSGLRGTGSRNRPGTARQGASRTRGGSSGTRRPGANRKPAAAPPPAPEPGVPTITRDDSQVGAGARRRAGLTTRAIALAVVLLILTISYASSLRVYFNQRQDLAATRQQIITSQQNIDNLSDEITRWNDPDYVRTQARIRLGWVMPGERGYRVVGPDGKPITGDTEIAGEKSTPAPKKAWYTKMWGSVETADHPKPAGQQPADEPPITEDTKPGSGAASPTGKPTG